ncbi:1091_t:CDS:2, partial [Racocetra fulgida]
MREKLAIITYFEQNPMASKHSTAQKFDIIPKHASPAIKWLTIGACPKYLLLE